MVKILEENLSQIEGHAAAKSLLSKLLNQGTPRAFCLVGPPHVGKGFLARALAASIHGIAYTGKPHIDTLIFDELLSAHSEEGEKKWKRSVDALIQVVHLSPAASRHKVIIIDDIDRLSHAAANALLKTLEEPPGDVRILLTAQDIDSVLPTIRSRAQLVRLNYLTDDEMRRYIAQGGRGVPEAQEIMVLANGAVGKAKQLLGDKDLLKRQRSYLETFENLLRGRVRAGLKTAELREREAAEEMVEVWINLARRLWLAPTPGQGQPVVT